MPFFEQTEKTLKNRGVEQFKVQWCASLYFFFIFFFGKMTFFQREKEGNLKNRGVEQFKVQWCADFGRKQKSYPSCPLRIHIIFNVLLLFYF